MNCNSGAIVTELSYYNEYKSDLSNGAEDI